MAVDLDGALIIDFVDRRYHSTRASRHFAFVWFSAVVWTRS